MQAITTKFIGPTNFRGSRISAKFGSSRMIVAYDNSMSPHKNHEQAALAILKKQGLDDKYNLVRGSLDNGYVFVLLEKEWKS